MHNFFKSNQKAILGVVVVLLMIAWLQSPNARSSYEATQNQLIGTIGDKKILKNDLDQSALEWDFLSKHLAVRTGSTGPNQWSSILALQQFGPLAGPVHENTDTYYLLMHEAREMGFAPQFEEASKALADPNSNVGLVQVDGRIIQYDQADESMQQMAQRALADLIMVTSAFQRALDTVKVSQPLLDHEMAMRMQQVKVRVADFPVKDYEDKVAPPTEEQLKKHFDQFASFEAGEKKNDTNPFGFGYKYPNRVKVQYIGIPRVEVRKAVQASKDDYTWEVEANSYYLKHLSEFPNTPATTQSTAFLIGPTTSFGPTTKPFDEVRKTIIDRLIEPLVNRLQTQIQTEVSNRLTQDYQAYSTAKGATSGPATMPYESFEHFQKIAADIQTRHKVTLTVASVADAFRDATELKELPGIGKVPSFADYALTAAEPFAAPTIGNQSMIIKDFEPSKALTDESSSVYFFRVTAVDHSHQPASMAEVKERVEQDWKKMTAFETARADAKKLAEAAREPGLDVAAGDHKVVIAGPFGASSSFAPIDNYTILTTSQPEFIRQSLALLSVLTEKDHPRPIATIELPADAKIAVVELIAVESALPPELADQFKSFMAAQVSQPYASSLISQWFEYDSVAQRIGYQDQTSGHRKTR